MACAAAISSPNRIRPTGSAVAPGLPDATWTATGTLVVIPCWTRPSAPSRLDRNGHPRKPDDDPTHINGNGLK
ncbi:hypothetical protein Taro_037923 [Colocasia esculenta]|uniref:Uncharacterized protein n=1 Tax=Colocasia esculenta TaxID=4460 RepID=A0A843WHP4_COLES|nr:hypothetical protein [Colocasia esculenta]